MTDHPADYYDLILMAVMMPNNVYEKGRVASLDSGMDDFTEKAIFVEKLFETIFRRIHESDNKRNTFSGY